VSATEITDPRPVVDRLRSDVLRGVFPPGDRLVEQVLCERYDVGRAAIRAALAELDAEALVVREENRGASVRRVSLSEAIEITEARAALEGLVARRAAERATKDDRVELRAIVKAMSDAVRARELAEYSRLNVALHRRIQAMARYAIAADLIENLRNRAADHQYRLSGIPGRAARSLPEHRAIVAAIVAGDADRAETAMRAHLASVANVLRHWEELAHAEEVTA
jgi:DNA-binding GntR family transcriptional regulator